MFIIVNIGCIECGVSSDIVGVFDTREEAERIAKACDKVFSWREGGQNNFEVFPMPVFNEIREEYSEIKRFLK